MGADVYTIALWTKMSIIFRFQKCILAFSDCFKRCWGELTFEPIFLENLWRQIKNNRESVFFYYLVCMLVQCNSFAAIGFGNITPWKWIATNFGLRIRWEHLNPNIRFGTDWFSERSQNSFFSKIYCGKSKTTGYLFCVPKMRFCKYLHVCGSLTSISSRSTVWWIYPLSRERETRSTRSSQ